MQENQSKNSNITPKCYYESLSKREKGIYIRMLMDALGIGYSTTQAKIKGLLNWKKAELNIVKAVTLGCYAVGVHNYAEKFNSQDDSTAAFGSLSII